VLCSENGEHFHGKCLYYVLKIVKIKELKFTLQPVMKAQRGSGCIALLFL